MGSDRYEYVRSMEVVVLLHVHNMEDRVQSFCYCGIYVLFEEF